MSSTSLALRGGLLIGCASILMVWAFLLWGLAWSHIGDKDAWQQPIVLVLLLAMSPVMLVHLRHVDHASLRPSWKRLVRVTLALGPMLSALAVLGSLLAFESTHANGLGQLAYAVGGLASALLGVGLGTLGRGFIRAGKTSADA